jgi:hypothetical protein
MDTAEIVRIANANERLMDGTTGPVRLILQNNDLVFAVWQDAAVPGGVSTLILKGQRRLKAIASDKDVAPSGTVKLGHGSQQMRWSAVKVLNSAMAIAARQTLGEAE